MRRLADLIFAAVALVLLSPVLVGVALAVLITSPGNPFYLARRVGRSGVAFRMWKFRTMVKNAALCGPPITGHNDPRITAIGRFLRSTKLDELPQFINLLLGHMTLVGPRPETPEIVELYSPEQRMILSVKPGVTGPGQVRGEESESIPEGVQADEYYVNVLLNDKIGADLQYIRHRTAWSDVRILGQTALLVIRSLLSRGSVEKLNSISPKPASQPAAAADYKS